MINDVNFNKIKIIIWDLDDTFWNGTISEEAVKISPENIKLLKDLTDIGIVNTICSKNDFDQIKSFLEKYSIWEYFICPSINWESKGNRINNLLKDIGLRSENALFIDDNIQNINEALFYNPGIMTSSPDIISNLIKYADGADKKDKEHKRLKQYKVLEKKLENKRNFSSNEDFLYSINTIVNIKNDCLNVIDRIYELIQRTNQLNFTKKRISKETLLQILNDKSYQCCYVNVSDKFGDYGIVGFCALKDGKLEHFLFSCRTIGQGIEQYVYAYLNYPLLDIVQPVINTVDKSKSPGWINQSSTNIENYDLKNESTKSIKVLFKGPCDMAITCSFLERSTNIIEEFTYVGDKKHNSIEQHNHTEHILQTKLLNEQDKNEIIKDCIFSDDKMFDTAIFNEDVKIVFLSTLTDTNLGVYENINNGNKVIFGEWCTDITNPENFKKILSKDIYTAFNNFTEEDLISFKNKYKYIGRISPQQTRKNIEKILSLMPKSSFLVLILGSEIPYNNNTQEAYINRHEDHKKINAELRDLAKRNNRVLIIDVNEYIKGQDDFTNNINHYSKRVYFEIANKSRSIIEDITNIKINNKSGYQLFIDKLSQIVLKTIKPSSSFYPILKRIYRKIR